MWRNPISGGLCQCWSQSTAASLQWTSIPAGRKNPQLQRKQPVFFGHLEDCWPIGNPRLVQLPTIYHKNQPYMDGMGMTLFPELKNGWKSQHLCSFDPGLDLDANLRGGGEKGDSPGVPMVFFFQEWLGFGFRNVEFREVAGRGVFVLKSSWVLVQLFFCWHIGVRNTSIW